MARRYRRDSRGRFAGGIGSSGTRVSSAPGGGRVSAGGLKRTIIQTKSGITYKTQIVGTKRLNVTAVQASRRSTAVGYTQVIKVPGRRPTVDAIYVAKNKRGTGVSVQMLKQAQRTTSENLRASRTRSDLGNRLASRVGADTTRKKSSQKSYSKELNEGFRQVQKQHRKQYRSRLRARATTVSKVQD